MFKSKVFVKYFISYIVLLVTVFSVLMLIFAYVISFTRRTIETSALNQFEQIGVYFKEKISELKNTADLMCNNEYLTHYKLSNADYITINGIKELKKISVSNSFIYDVFICYKDDFVYSPKGKAAIDVYMNNILLLDEISTGKMKKAILYSVETEMLSLYLSGGIYNDQPKYMLYTYPIMRYNRSIGTIGFIISQDTLKKSLAKMLGEHGVGVRMFLPDGEIISEVNRSGIEDLFTGGYTDDYMFYSHKIDAPAFSFNVAIDSESVFSYVKQLKRWSYSTVIIVLTSSVLLSYVFSRKHYKPIKMLKKQVITDTGNTVNDTGNEFDAILKAINRDQAENKQLMKKLEDNSFILRQQACGLLFSGVFQDDDNIKNLIKLSGINAKEPYFSVMIMCWGKKERDSQDAYNLIKQLDNRFGGYYVTSVMGRYSMVFLIGLKGWDSGRKTRKAVAENIQEYFEEDSEAYICFGRVYDDISFISSSYKEALICVEKCAITRSDRFAVFFESLASLGGNDYCFDSENLSKLINALENGDLKRSNKYFDEVMEKLRDKNLSPESQMFHHYDLLHQLFHYFKKNRTGTYLSEIVRIDCFSAENFSADMKKLFKLMCNSNAYEMHENIICKIIDYIDSHYSNNDLDLSFLAQEFNISHNYISKYFKEKTGESYIQYLSKLRMEKAYKLICSTDMPIGEISSKVGYLDSVSFTKKFKKAFQLTPSELRLKVKG